MNPVFIHHGKYYFWDETWSQCYGPIISAWLAQAKCRQYAQTLEGEQIDYSYPGAKWHLALED